MECRVAIVDDEQGVLDVIKAGLEVDKTFVCVGCYRTAETALAEILRRPADVVLMDIGLPGLSGIAATIRLKALLPKTHVIMLTGSIEADSIFQSLAAGASGYLVKPVSLIACRTAISEVLAGEAPLSREATRTLVQFFNFRPLQADESAKLSQREAEIMAGIARNAQDKEIADQLGIGVATVRTHLRRMYRKLKVKNRAEAMAKYAGIPTHFDPGQSRPWA